MELGRRARSGDGLLDLRRWIFVDLYPRVRCSEQNHTARVPEHHCRAHVPGVEDVLDRQHRRLVTANQLRHSLMDLGKPLRQRVTWLGADNPALDKSQRIAAFLANYPVARD